MLAEFLYPGFRLLVFARAPVAGQAKTRLIPAIGPEAAARVQAGLLSRTMQTAVTAALCPVQLWCSPDDTHPAFLDWNTTAGVSLHAQPPGDLGQRMHAALTAALEAADGAVVIGTDCPALDRDYLAGAFEALARGADAVVGPAEDGGYVLLGIRRPMAELFTGIPWGTGEVLSATRARLQQGGANVVELASRWDLDRPADLARAAPWISAPAF